ncbi:monocarboxylate transporter 12-like [Styela clava]
MVLIVKTLHGNTLYHNSPDGGWAWVVLASAFCIQAITVSFIRSLGMFHNYFMDEFETTNSQTSFISSIASAMDGIVAPFIGILMLKFGARKMIMLSGVFCCFGLILSAIGSNICMAYIGIGVLWGAGFTVSYICITAQVNIYFTRWRGIANGVATCGSACGSMLMPVLAQHLLSAYGWRGSMWLCAGVALNVCVCATLVRPISVINAMQMTEYKNVQYADKPIKMEDEVTTTSSEESSCYEQSKSQEAIQLNSGKNGQDRIFYYLKNYWLLFILALTEFAFGLWYFFPLMFAVPFAKELRCSSEQAAIILSVAAVADIICRVTCGVLLSWHRVLERNILYFLALITLAQVGACFIAIFANDFKGILTYATIHGGLFGFFITAKTATTATLFGVEDFVKFIGPQWAISGVSCLIGPPVAGHLVDIYGTYRAAYWFALFSFLLSVVLLLISGMGVQKLGAVLPRQRNR